METLLKSKTLNATLKITHLFLFFSIIPSLYIINEKIIYKFFIVGLPTGKPDQQKKRNIVILSLLDISNACN